MGIRNFQETRTSACFDSAYKRASARSLCNVATPVPPSSCHNRTKPPTNPAARGLHTTPDSAHDFPPSPKLESYVADDSSFLASLSFRAAFMKSCSAQRF